MEKDKNFALGAFQIIFSGFCFGFLGVFGKWAFELGLSPREFLAARFICASALISIYITLFQPRKKILIPTKQILICMGLGVFGYAIFSSCYFQALKGLSASMTVLLLYMYPAIVAVASKIFFKDQISPIKWFAIALTMAGLILTVQGDMRVDQTSAIFFGIGSALFYALYILFSGHFLKRIDSLVATFWIQLSAGLLLTAFSFDSLTRTITIYEVGWKVLFLTALVGTVFAMSLFLAGLKKVKSWEASILSTAEPVAGIALGIFFLQETFSGVQYLGALAILCGMVLISLPARKL